MLLSHHYYYLHNFRRAIDWVRQRYADVLDATEIGFIDSFHHLPCMSQALLVRLLMRRGPWFLERKLGYAEIPSVSEAARPLLNLAWLDDERPMSLQALFALHTKPELLRLFPHASIRSSTSKAHMLQTLLAAQDGEKTYRQWNPQSSDSAWCVTLGDLCERLRLMFFGNLHQTWSEFVLADLDIFKYEKVHFDAASRGFDCRADIDCYVALDRCRQALTDGEAPAAVLLEAARCHSAAPWLEARRAKLLLRIGQACERAHHWELAEQAYGQCHYPGARHRHARVYERTGRFHEALALAQAAKAAPESEEETQRAARMLPRLQRRLGQQVELGSAHSRAAFLRQEDTLLEQPRQPEPVERVVQKHLHSASAPVFYVENTLLNALFGLLCWPAIFAPLPGAFFHPFQSRPADLYQHDFVLRRKPQFDACLDLLDDGSYQRIVRQRFADKYGVQSPFVAWKALSDELLGLALDCIPPNHLRLVFLRMLRDLKANRSGLPDLVRFWPAQRRYELVEVKAPGDKLQDNQTRWLHYFSEHGIPALVCRVCWRDTAAVHRLERLHATPIQA